MRHKDFGIWQSWSWADMLDEVRRLSVGLKAIGFKRGDKVAVVGSNRPRLYWTFPAVQALGGVPSGARPLPSAPRNRGQSAVSEEAARRSARAVSGSIGRVFITEW